MQAILTDLTRTKGMTVSQKIMLHPVTDKMAQKLAERTGDSNLGTRVATSLFTYIQQEIEKNNIPAWGNAGMFKGQRIQHPVITAATMVEETEKSLKRMGADKATRYWIVGEMLDIARENQPEQENASVSLNTLTATREQLSRFRNHSPGIQPEYRKSF